MACSDCFPGNSTVIIGGSGVDINGTGTPSDPYEISVFSQPEGDWAYAETRTAAPDLDMSSFTLPVLVRATLTGAGEVNLPSWGAGRSGSLTLVLQQDGTGGRTLDFAGAGVLSQAPIALSTDPGAIDVVVLIWTGTEWIGFLSASAVA